MTSCCNTQYLYGPELMKCSGKNATCIIPPKEPFYFYRNTYFCLKCFQSKKGRMVLIQHSPRRVVDKTLFKTEVNKGLKDEEVIDCRFCRRIFHQVCVLYIPDKGIWPDGFICDDCLNTNGITRPPNPFSSDQIPKTCLDYFLETKVNDFLEDMDSGAQKVVIRVIASIEKNVCIFPAMEKLYVHTGRVIPPLNYRYKTIYAFQKIGAAEVCIFGMIVQEYGSECPSPNTRRVYLSFLDSVNFFSPSDFRSKVYKEIILGYLEYVKQLGFQTAHLWACAPSQGEDYLFNRHPKEQMYLDQNRLQKWYVNLLKKGESEGIVPAYMDIMQYAREEKLSLLSELPYFEGDYVSRDAIEECFSELEEVKPKKDGRGRPPGFNGILGGDPISKKVASRLQLCKERFFVIRLKSEEDFRFEQSMPIVDPDPLIYSDLMSSRDNFLNYCKENHLEFSSLRRAKYSTMKMLYELHREIFQYRCHQNIFNYLLSPPQLLQDFENQNAVQEMDTDIDDFDNENDEKMTRVQSPKSIILEAEQEIQVQVVPVIDLLSNDQIGYENKQEIMELVNSCPNKGKSCEVCDCLLQIPQNKKTV